jgi:hypothetical protein
MRDLLKTWFVLIAIIVGASLIGCGVEEDGTNPPADDDSSDADGGTTPSSPSIACALPNASTLRLTIAGIGPQALIVAAGSSGPVEADLKFISVGSNVTGWNAGVNSTPQANYAGASGTVTLDLSASTNRFTPFAWSSRENKAYWLDLLKVSVSGDGCRVVDDGFGGKVIVR